MSPYLLFAKPDHSSQCILAFTSMSFGMQRQPVCPRVARSVAFAHVVQFFLLIAVANDSLFTFYLVALHIQILVHAQVQRFLTLQLHTNTKPSVLQPMVSMIR